MLNSQLGMPQMARTRANLKASLCDTADAPVNADLRVPRLRRMEMRTGRTRIVAALVLAMALAGSIVPAHAAGPAAQASWRWPGLAALWAWFVDCGIMIDPNGGCAAAAVQTTCGRGIHIDPNGRCAAAATVQRDCGIMIDPDGHCITSSASGASPM